MKFYPVKKDNKWGLINLNGDLVLGWIDEIDLLKRSKLDSIFFFAKDNLFGLMDKKGNILFEPSFVLHQTSYDRLLPVCIEKLDDDTSDGIWKLLDLEDFVLLEKSYDNIYPFYNDVAKFKKEERYGILSSLGEEIIPAVYDQIFGPFDDKYIVNHDWAWGVIDSDNNVVIYVDYPVLDVYNNGVAIIGDGQYYGLIDLDGNFVFEISYDEILTFETEDVTWARTEDVWYVISKSGQIIKEFTDITHCRHFYNGFSVVKKENKCGLVDINGNVVVDFKYVDILEFSEGKAWYKVKNRLEDSWNELWGILDEDGREVIPAFLDSEYPEPFRNGYSWFTKDNSVGLVDADGNIVIEPKYDLGDVVCHGFVLVNKGYHVDPVEVIYGKWGILDIKDNELIVPCKFDYISDICNLENKLAFMSAGDRYYYLNEDLEVVWAEIDLDQI